MNRVQLYLGGVLVLTATAIFADAPVVEAGSDYKGGEHTSARVQAPVNETQTQAVDSNNQSDSKNQSDTKKADSSKDQSAEDQQSDQSQQPQPQTDQSNAPVDQRVGRVEKQVNNIANMNFPQQIALLQQQIAQLRGQLEVQGHDLQLLNKQVRSFYQDLDGRISQLNNLNSGNTSSQAKADNKNTKMPTNMELQDANTYQTAFTLLTNHKYDKSVKAFTNYINDYPNGKYVADAHYWLGELYLIQKDPKKAAKEFNTVTSKYPKSAKVSDAKLKIAIIHANSGQTDKAKKELLSIKKQHPDSTAAQLANIRLQQMEQSD